MLFCFFIEKSKFEKLKIYWFRLPLLWREMLYDKSFMTWNEDDTDRTDITDLKVAD